MQKLVGMWLIKISFLNPFRNPLNTQVICQTCFSESTACVCKSAIALRWRLRDISMLFSSHLPTVGHNLLEKHSKYCW